MENIKRLTKRNTATRKGYRSISNRNVSITDRLFGHYVDLVAEKTLPYQLDILNDRLAGMERSHCLDNFRIAAGDLEDEYYGTVFLDTDAYKWLEAVAYCLESGKCAGLSPHADEVIDLIARAQQPDGYLNTYWTIVRPQERWTNLVEGHELYSAGHMIEAAVAHFNATEKRSLLDVAIRFADLIAHTFGPRADQKHGYPGHQEIELALVKLYRVTGERRYLDTARYFIDQRGTSPNYLLAEIRSLNGPVFFPEFHDYDLKYSQAHMPPVQQRSVEGHAVRAMYMSSAMADLALEYDDPALRDACAAIWESTTNRRMFVTGGIGSSGHLERFTADYDLPNGGAYCETCASVGLMMFGQRMASLFQDARFYDEVERALHNTVLAGVNADGSRYFYVNPQEMWPDACLPATAMSHIKPVRQQWFSVACCPTNIARTLASLGQYIYAEQDEVLYIHQFISSEVTTTANGMPVTVTMTADITRDHTVHIRTDGSIALRVRIPSYAEHPSFVLDGIPFEPTIERGYACIAAEGVTEVLIDFHIVPRWVAANDAVRADAGKSALTLGPFVYCLEEIDNGQNLASVSVAAGTPVEITGSLEELPGTMPTLSYEGLRTLTRVDTLYGAPTYSVQPVHITAVPYCLWCNRTPGEMIIWQRVRL